MSIFSKIATGEIPSYKVAADESHYAFLDINPVRPGHTLVIPRREVDYLFDLSNDEYLSLMAFAKRVAAGLKKATGCKRVGVAVLGMEVPHAHIHLVPLNRETDLDLFGPKMTIAPEEMARIAQSIANEIN